jgi:carbamoyl-phosphate synthase large subunit
VVVKFARWAFEKFDGLEDKLGTQMQAVGEVMSIGKNYKEAFQKSIRSLEIGRHGLGFAKDFSKKPLDELMCLLTHPSSERQFIMYEALRKGADVDELTENVHQEMVHRADKELVEEEEILLKYKGACPRTICSSRQKKTGSRTNTCPRSSAFPKKRSGPSASPSESRKRGRPFP